MENIDNVHLFLSLSESKFNATKDFLASLELLLEKLQREILLHQLKIGVGHFAGEEKESRSVVLLGRLGLKHLGLVG